MTTNNDYLRLTSALIQLGQAAYQAGRTSHLGEADERHIAAVNEWFRLDMETRDALMDWLGITPPATETEAAQLELDALFA